MYSHTSTNNVSALQMVSFKIYFLINLSMGLYVAYLKPCWVVWKILADLAVSLGEIWPSTLVEHLATLNCQQQPLPVKTCL